MKNKNKLFLIHFAGGNKYSYQPILPLLSDFETLSLELPGRGNRINEKLITNLVDAVNDIRDQILQNINGHRFLIFGHSLGAMLGFFVSMELELYGCPPAYLIVSGNSGPEVKSGKNYHEMTSDVFFEEVYKLGGLPKEIISNHQLRSFFEPIIRADFQINEARELSKRIKLNIPIYAIMGEQEEFVESVTNWKRFTSGAFDYEILPGDHFFLFSNKVRIAKILSKCNDYVNVL